MNLKAAVLTKIKKPLKIINNLKISKLKRGQVLVNVLHSAICRSQIMEIEGKRGNDKYIPHLLGQKKERKIFTVYYPEETVRFPVAYRGRPVLAINHEGHYNCVACGLCEAACPA